MATQIIPLTPEPSQEFTIDLDGQTIQLNVRWNATAGQWFMNLVGITFDTIINGITLVTGINLLDAYAVRELGELWMVDLDEENAEPDFDNFGDRFQLMYVTK